MFILAHSFGGFGSWLVDPLLLGLWQGSTSWWECVTSSGGNLSPHEQLGSKREEKDSPGSHYLLQGHALSELTSFSSPTS
jgi:hypothetical protein